MAIHNIKLTYDPAAENVTAENSADPIRKGDQLNFDCDLGPVHLLMIPGDQFSAAEFKTGDYPLEVRTNSGFRYCCGVTVAGKSIGFPAHQNFGQSEDPPPDGRGTTGPK